MAPRGSQSLIGHPQYVIARSLEQAGCWLARPACDVTRINKEAGSWLAPTRGLLRHWLFKAGLTDVTREESVTQQLRTTVKRKQMMINGSLLFFFQFIYIRNITQLEYYVKCSNWRKWLVINFIEGLVDGRILKFPLDIWCKFDQTFLCVAVPWNRQLRCLNNQMTDAIFCNQSITAIGSIFNRWKLFSSTFLNPQRWRSWWKVIPNYLSYISKESQILLRGHWFCVILCQPKWFDW